MTKYLKRDGVTYRVVGQMPVYQGAVQMQEAYERQTGKNTFLFEDDGTFYIVIKDND